MIRTLVRGGGAFSAAASLSLVFASVAGAQPPQKELGLAIDAVGFPSYFVYDAKPGSTVRGTLRVRNIAGEPRVGFLRAVDVKTAATGGLEYGSQSRKPRGTGSWIRLAARTLRLPGGAAVEVPFTARIPRDARSGDHLAGIVAFDNSARRARRGAGGRFRLRFVSRLAIAVQFKLPGRRATRLDVRDASVQVRPSGAILGVRLANRGNTLIRKTVGNVTVSRGGKRLFSRRIQLDSFVPKTEIEYPVPWQGVPVEGDYEVNGEIIPRGGKRVELDRKASFGKERIREFRKETGGRAVEADGTSPLLLVALGVALAAVAALGVGYLRLSRRTKA